VSFERRCVDSAKIHVDVCWSDAALRHGQLMETFKIFLAGTAQFQQQPSQSTQQGLTPAQQPQSFANYVYDPTTGYYYDSTTGLYYDANTQVRLSFVQSTLLLIT